MDYQKPEIVRHASAVASIRGSMQQKPFGTWQDSSPTDDNRDATTPAYEADE